MSAIRTAERGTDTETLFGEIQTDTRVLAQPIEVTPDHVRHVHTALHDQILDQPAEIVLRQRSRDHRALAPALTHRTRDVVFAAAFPDLEAARVAHATEARIETQHHFAERGAVPASLSSRFDLH